MTHLSLGAKEAIVKQVLNGNGETLAEIAKTNNIGYSTLQKWLKATREGNPLSNRRSASANRVASRSEKVNHLLATANLDDVTLGTYCRKQGIYSHQLTQWKEDIMSDSINKKLEKQLEEFRALKSENKKLKKELRRKDKALAETSALLILKKKANLIWGDHEDD